jgi:hypothetical protein
MERKKLSEKARNIRNSYQRKWYAAHPGKHSEYQIRYWERKAEKEELQK